LEIGGEWFYVTMERRWERFFSLPSFEQEGEWGSRVLYWMEEVRCGFAVWEKGRRGEGVDGRKERMEVLRYPR